MKKIFLGLALVVAGIIAKAQGFEGLVVEKYYVSTAGDGTGSTANGGGTLPTGSVTWRFYVDLAPGYKLQAVYGVDQAPTGAGGFDHTTSLSTTTTFFNNEDRGSTAPTYTKAQTALNSVMLDSWISLGAACNGYYGIQKTADNGVSNTVNSNGMLANNAPAVGVPLTTQDGLIAGSPEAVLTVGIAPADLAMLDQTSQFGNLFSISNGSWYTTNGATGPDATNRVLIAQVTTEGVLTYNFNIQIISSTNVVERYVTSNANALNSETVDASLTGVLNQPNACPTISLTSPTNGGSYFVGDNVTLSATANDANGTVTQVEFFVNNISVGIDNSGPGYSFNYTATAGTKNITAVATDNEGCTTTTTPIVTITVGTNSAPTVSVTAPAGGTIVVEGATVAISATAADGDGTVSQVEFFVDGVSIGVDNTGPAPYTFNWTSVIGNHTITAKATDNNNAVTTSTGVAITAISSSASYTVVSSNNTCDVSTFCVPVAAVAAVNDVKGYDLVLRYDKDKVQPTGVVVVQNNLVNPAFVTTANSIDAANGLMYLSLYFNSSAPGAAEFNGTGTLFCAEFVKTALFLATDTVIFTVPQMQESYNTGIQLKITNSGDVKSSQNTTYSSSLTFWTNGAPLGYDGTGTNTLRTDIYGSDSACTTLSVTAVQPDTAGHFSFNLGNGDAVSIQRDIANTTSVQPVVNGFDAFLTRRLLINDATFTPSAFQMIAMDVNVDGVVSAGDLSQINQRAVLQIGEYKQAWNYNASGVSNGSASKDWLFLAQSSQNAPAYLISSTFPFDDGVGYSKSRVPVTAFCQPVPVFATPSSGCLAIDQETYTGVLLGDVNGNFASVGSGGSFKTEPTDKVILNLTNAVVANGFVDVPVEISSVDAVNSVDFAVTFDESKLTYNSIGGTVGYLSVLDNFNTTDRTVRVTSSTMNNINNNQTLFTVRFATTANQLSEVDFTSADAYLNGEKVGFAFKNEATAVPTLNSDVNVAVYPNPAKNILTVKVSEKATVQLMDINGKVVMAQANANANEALELNVQSLASGVYMLKVYNGNFTSTKRVVINK